MVKVMPRPFHVLSDGVSGLLHDGSCQEQGFALSDDVGDLVNGRDQAKKTFCTR